MSPGFFDGPEWLGLLRSSLASGTLAPGEAGSASWTLFSRGPVTAAYTRFPLGWAGHEPELAGLPLAACERLRRAGVDLLRLSAPRHLLAAGRSGIDLPETILEGLSDWDADSLGAGMRRKFAAGRKAGLQVVPVAAVDGSLLHGLYRDTVSRQGGALRYTRSYFDGLCRIAGGPLHAVKVLDGDQSPVGFLVYALDGSTAVYLHGGYRAEAGAARPGYFAMRWVLEHCRALGALKFNFLVSPADQPSLVAFKESFGGRTTLRAHWQQSLSLSGRLAGVLLDLRAR